jgi:hypothetical protein|tara:strand:+ start:173 stop:421 length:249 start_codon:yes stop_codon:yes gene_type:complete
MKNYNLRKDQLSIVHNIIEENDVPYQDKEQLLQNYRDTIINLDISITYLLQDFSDIKRKDIQHLQDLITKLFMLGDKNDISK